MAKKLKVKLFPIDDMKMNRVILVVGKRGTGKSTLVKDILYHLRNKVDIGFAMSPTYDTQKMFEDCLPQSHIYNEYSLETLRNLLTSMDYLKSQGKIRHAVLTIDDCMFDKGIMKTKDMRELHMNGRHLNICFINSVQYLMDMGPELRSQIDYLFVLKENTISMRKKLHTYYFGIFEKYEEFSMVMDKCTNNYECLVLDNTQKDNKIEDSVYYYKANPNIGKFRVGKTIYFKLDNMYQRESQSFFNPSQKLKMPDAIKTKGKIEIVEKDDDND